jgi:hypothetical protein
VFKQKMERDPEVPPAAKRAKLTAVPPPLLVPVLRPKPQFMVPLTQLVIAPKKKAATKKKGDGKLQCLHCPVSCRFASDLQLHIDAVHENYRDHDCEHCSHTFARIGDLNVHVQTVHDNHREHVCEHCQRTFGRKSSLKIHIETVHQHNKDHICDHCQRAFGHRHSLKMHIAKMHPEVGNPALRVGEKVERFWSDDGKWYRATITDQVTGYHGVKHVITFDDGGETETVPLHHVQKGEQWRPIAVATAAAEEM